MKLLGLILFSLIVFVARANDLGRLKTSLEKQLSSTLEEIATATERIKLLKGETNKKPEDGCDERPKRR